jgi:hypothetical protein
MNILTATPSYMSSLRQTLSVSDRPSFDRPEPAGDSVTLSSSSSNFDLQQTLTWGGLGAVPAIGAVSNFTAGIMTGIAGQKGQSDAALLGMASNVLGTGALITGLLIGSTPTTAVGAALLVASGVAGGYAIQ